MAVVETKQDIIRSIYATAAAYGVSGDEMYQTIGCETGWTFNPSIQSNVIRKDGTREESYGLSQINLPAHPDISKEQAKDSTFALSYMASAFRAGQKSQWTCWVNMRARNLSLPSTNQTALVGKEIR